MKRKGKNNSGFTLVELLVAIAILAIVVAPLLHSFVTGARLNAKSKKIMDATTVAQNVMEDIKATSLEELFEKTFEEKGEDGSVTEKKLVRDGHDGTYTITYENIMADKQLYRAEVLLDTNSYTSATGEALGYNDMELADIYMMDSDFDAFYEVTLLDDTRQAERFTEDGSALADMKRTITVDISKNGDTIQVNVSVAYTYQGLENIAVADNCIYKNMDAKLQLRNVYLFFEPMYTGLGQADIRESVEIRNLDNVPVNLFMVKQKNNHTTELNEQKYAVNVNVEENRSGLTETDYQPVTVLRNNLESKQLNLHYAGRKQQLIGRKIFTAAELLGLDTLTGSKVDDRLYRIEVSVYDEKDTKLVTISGTKEK